MANYGGENFTTVRGINLLNTAAIRVGMAQGMDSTLSVKADMDAARSWSFPDKTGTFGITGTFTVNLPAVTAGQSYGTNVTVTGVRVEDAMVCTVQKTFATTTLNDWANNGGVILAGCQTGNGGVNLTFINPTASASIYSDLILAYTIVR